MKKISIMLLTALLALVFVTSCSSTQGTATQYLEDPDYPYLLITESGAVTRNGRTFSSYINSERTLVIPETLCGIQVTSIESEAFADYVSIKAVVLPDSITTIGSKAFYGCTNLTSFTAPASLTSIGAKAFMGCTGLSKVSLNDGLKKIGNYAFKNCTALGTIVIPTSVTSIGSQAFAGDGANTTVISASDDTYASDWDAYSDATFSVGDKVRIDYHMNGASGAIEGTYAAYGTEYTISSEVPARDGYTFAGWVIEGTTTVYQPGETMTVPADDAHLLATWN